MAEDKSATPEQQLLKLIEGEKPRAGKGRPDGTPKGRGFLPGSLAKAPAALIASLSFWKRRAKKKSFSRNSSFGIREANKALVAVALVLLVYVVFDAVASARNLQRPPDFAAIKERVTKPSKEAVEPLQETSYYLQKVASRDIFREGKKEDTSVKIAPEAVNTTTTSEAVQSLALVGISWSSNPDAIIEDKSKQRTYFVKRGQDVGNGVKVEAIFKDHVVVTFEDREYELR